MKCLEKERARRYETANGLANDVKRHLNCEPVVARPPSRLYEFQKTVRRHKFGFAAATALIMVLAVGVVVSTLEALRATQAEREQSRLRRQAQASQGKSQTEAAKATAISDLLQEMLRSANPDSIKGAEYTVRQLLDDFSTDLGKQLAQQPEVEATIRATIGNAYYRLGAVDKAEPHLQRALALRRRLYGEESIEVAQSLVDHAWNLSERARQSEAEAEVRQALGIYGRRGADPQAIIHALCALGVILNLEGRFKDVETVSEQALALARSSPKRDFPEIANILHNLADTEVSQAKYVEAEHLATQAIEMHRRLHGPEHPETAWSFVMLGRALAGQQKLAEAERAYQGALDIFRKHISVQHSTLQLVLTEMGKVLIAEGKVAEAEKLLGEELEGRIGQSTNRDSLVAFELGRAEHGFGKTARDGGNLDTAERAFRLAVSALERAVFLAPTQAEYRLELFWTYRDLFGSTGNIEEIRHAIAVLDRALEDFPDQRDKFLEQQAHNYGLLALHHAELKEYPAAREASAASTTFFREFAKTGGKATGLEGEAVNFQRIGDYWTAEGRTKEAHEAYREALAVNELIEEQGLALQITPGWIAGHYDELDRVLAKVGTPDDASRIAQVLRPVDAKAGAAVLAALANCHLRLAEVLRKGGKLDDASAQVAKAKEIAASCHGAMTEYEKLASVPNRRTEVWDFAISYEALARRLMEIGQTQEAETAHRDAQTLWRKLVAAANTEDNRFHLAANCDALGLLLRDAGRAAESLESYRAAQAIWVELVAEFNHEDRRVHLGWTDENIGSLLRDAKRFDEASDAFQQAIEVWRKLVADFNKQDYRNHLFWTLTILAETLRNQGKDAEVQTLEREVADGGNVPMQNDIAWRLATDLDPRNRNGSNAVVYAERAVSATTRTNASYLDTLAAAYAELSQFDKAVGVQSEAVALLRNEEERKDYASRLRLYESKIPYRDDSQMVETIQRQSKAGNYAEAEPLARQCLALREKQIPDDWRAFNARSMLGGTLLGQKKYGEETEAMLLTGYKGMKQRENTIPSDGRLRLKETLQRLVQLYEETNRPDQAAEWKQKLDEFNKTPK
jgi:tetratricopeptide (TPR) repeat protein